MSPAMFQNTWCYYYWTRVIHPYALFYLQFKQAGLKDLKHNRSRWDMKGKKIL